MGLLGLWSLGVLFSLYVYWGLWVIIVLWGCDVKGVVLSSSFYSFLLPWRGVWGEVFLFLDVDVDVGFLLKGFICPV